MAGAPHPVFQDNVPVSKGNARTYLPLRLGNPDALRAIDGSTFWLCYIQTLTSFFYRDTSDATSEDNGVTIIVDGNGWIWKSISSGAGISIDAAGPLADRGDFDNEDPGFAYFATDTELLYIRLTGGGWSSGSMIRGAQGQKGDTGDQVGQGAKGDKGDTGDQGAPGPQGNSFTPDEVVPDLAGRATYDAEAKNFAVLVESDSSNGDLPTLYFKLSAASGDWSGGFTFIGSGGDSDATEPVTEVTTSSSAIGVGAVTVAIVRTSPTLTTLRFRL